MSDKKTLHVAIIGSGPAGLMAAHVLASRGVRVSMFEKRPAPGRKLLIAGSSGLNVTFDCPADRFHEYYGAAAPHFQRIFREFPPARWLEFLNTLGLETFKGTSGRYFVRGMKAAPLLRSWVQDLRNREVDFFYRHECLGFRLDQKKVIVSFSGSAPRVFDAVCFCLGGGSYNSDEQPLRFPKIFTDQGIAFQPFEASNVGFEVDWPRGFLEDAEGLPLKGLVLTTLKGTRKGELVITRYGLEGTPVYAVGTTGQAYLDLKPELREDQIRARLLSVKERLSPIRRVKKKLALNPGALALIFHLTPKETLADLDKLIATIKRFPILFKGKRPLDEAISSAGGISLSELTPELMFHRFPGVFAAGELLDWDAPTGGFLIQGCVSQGYCAAKGIIDYLKPTASPPSA